MRERGGRPAAEGHGVPTVYLQFGLSQLTQTLRFGRRTVPGLTVGRQKVSGSRLILRALDGLAPGAPLLPIEPGCPSSRG